MPIIPQREKAGAATASGDGHVQSWRGGGIDAAGPRGMGEMELERSQGKMVVGGDKGLPGQVPGLCPKDQEPRGCPEEVTRWQCVGHRQESTCHLAEPQDVSRQVWGVYAFPPGAPRYRRCPSPDPLGAARAWRSRDRRLEQCTPHGKAGARRKEVKLARNPQT